jgi:diguanylate cyclase
MQLAVRLAAATIASLAGFPAIALLLWPGWAAALRDGGSLLPWRSGSWSLIVADAQGRAAAASFQTWLLIAITLLLATTLLSICFAVLRPEPPEAVAALSRAGDSSPEIDAEIARVVALIGTHLQGSGVHGAVLAKANAQLPQVSRPDQMRTIVAYLMVENDSMRARTAALQENLEQSRRQIAFLKSNLAVAKAEGISDGLTRLKNRRGFDLMLAGEIAAARSSGKPLSLVMADIDRFKAINDRLGHQGGDDVLRWFANLLAANMKGRDTVARYGGEEFAMILPQTGLANAALLAEQIRGQVEAADMRLPGASSSILRLTASFGAAELRDGDSSEALIRRADRRLYDAKAAGRNRVMS